MTFWDSEPPPPVVDPYAESAGGPERDPGASLKLSGPSGDVYVREEGITDLEWAQHFTAWCRAQPDPVLEIEKWTKRIRGGKE